MVQPLCACSVGLLLRACTPIPAESAGETDGTAPPGPLTEVGSWTTERLPPLGTMGPDGADTTGTGTTGADGGPGFIEDPDGLWDSIECSVWDQDCPPGEKCLPWSNDNGGIWNATHCIPVAVEPGREGDPCIAEDGPMGGVDDCDIGLICWSVDVATNVGYCVAFCTNANSPVCDDPDYECQFGGDNVFPVCIFRCDPVAQDCPGDADGCYPYNQTFGCAPDAGGDTGAHGDACEYLNVCDPGLACVDASIVAGCSPAWAGCCAPFCDLTAPAVCPGAGMECVPWYERDQGPLRYEHVGLCMLWP